MLKFGQNSAPRPTRPTASGKARNSALQRTTDITECPNRITRCRRPCGLKVPISALNGLFGTLRDVTDLLQKRLSGLRRGERLRYGGERIGLCRRCEWVRLGGDCERVVRH
jgi:hypothetical protein